MRYFLWLLGGICLLSAGMAAVSGQSARAFPPNPAANTDSVGNTGKNSPVARTAAKTTATQGARAENPSPAGEKTAGKKADGEKKGKSRKTAAETSRREKTRKGKEPARKRRSTLLTPAREAAAITFATLHHPELAQLLSRLKRGNQTAYRRAIRQLYLDSERLARIKERSAERYELELQIWKADSRIRLLAARLATADHPDPELESQLRDALRERADLKIRQLEMERQRLLQRVRKIDETISSLKIDREGAAEQHLQRALRSLGLKKRRGARPGRKKTGKTKETKTVRSRNRPPKKAVEDKNTAQDKNATRNKK